MQEKGEQGATHKLVISKKKKPESFKSQNEKDLEGTT